MQQDNDKELPMDQIVLVERELLGLGVPASVAAEDLRRLAKDTLWEALQMATVHELRTALGKIQTAYEVDYNAEACERAAEEIWKTARDTDPV
jgi:hypothetical protein